jgi:hypothetical protein
MANKKYYYKVTTNDLKSYHIGDYLKQDYKIPKRFSINYDKMNKWIFPKVKETKIAIFDSFINARKFTWGHGRIFKCIVKNPKRKKMLCSSGAFVSDSFSYMEIKKFWKTGKAPGNRKFPDRLQIAPDGTFVCDAVKLIKELKY